MYVSRDGIINNLVQIKKELGLFLMKTGQLLIKNTIDLI
ncbi:hypothetical protein VCRA2117O380_10143 [Vibrio crassostreae]|nr:hypothetical protein VCRA2119O381_110012 [Vibrio crassostreae]CAK1856284.1 hypothetical protein VCRA2119O382_10143 [Vibrio crassostreae]CAK1857970.1 hypothetical protein VCRA2117O380_10143 [Vibrio crassostreae]CAK1895300.1 hypothetical protein VCRA2117O379_10505 [Vibrio crassostreae]CAK2435866.1 hypothetical protein VCRA2113O360_10143 [Vibrio crassostreae]